MPTSWNGKSSIDGLFSWESSRMTGNTRPPCGNRQTKWTYSSDLPHNAYNNNNISKHEADCLLSNRSGYSDASTGAEHIPMFFCPHNDALYDFPFPASEERIWANNNSLEHRNYPLSVEEKICKIQDHEAWARSAYYNQGNIHERFTFPEKRTMNISSHTCNGECSLLHHNYSIAKVNSQEWHTRAAKPRIPENIFPLLYGKFDVKCITQVLEQRASRPLKLSRFQMVEAYAMSTLCLSCDSMEHKITNCPFGEFVCPNCHRASHRGEHCPLPCRFCFESHWGISVNECIRRSVRQPLERILGMKMPLDTSLYCKPASKALPSANNYINSNNTGENNCNLSSKNVRSGEAGAGVIGPASNISSYSSIECPNKFEKSASGALDQPYSANNIIDNLIYGNMHSFDGRSTGSNRSMNLSILGSANGADNIENSKTTATAETTTTTTNSENNTFCEFSSASSCTCEAFHTSDRPNTANGRSIYVSNMPSGTSKCHLEMALNQRLKCGHVVTIDFRERSNLLPYAFVELSSMHAAYTLVQNQKPPLRLGDHELKLQFKKIGLTTPVAPNSPSKPTLYTNCCRGSPNYGYYGPTRETSVYSGSTRSPQTEWDERMESFHEYAFTTKSSFSEDVNTPFNTHLPTNQIRSVSGNNNNNSSNNNSTAIPNSVTTTQSLDDCESSAEYASILDTSTNMGTILGNSQDTNSLQKLAIARPTKITANSREGSQQLLSGFSNLTIDGNFEQNDNAVNSITQNNQNHSINEGSFASNNNNSEIKQNQDIDGHLCFRSYSNSGILELHGPIQSNVPPPPPSCASTESLAFQSESANTTQHIYTVLSEYFLPNGFSVQHVCQHVAHKLAKDFKLPALYRPPLCFYDSSTIANYNKASANNTIQEVRQMKSIVCEQQPMFITYNEHIKRMGSNCRIGSNHYTGNKLMNPIPDGIHQTYMNPIGEKSIRETPIDHDASNLSMHSHYNGTGNLNNKISRNSFSSQQPPKYPYNVFKYGINSETMSSYNVRGGEDQNMESKLPKTLLTDAGVKMELNKFNSAGVHFSPNAYHQDFNATGVTYSKMPHYYYSDRINTIGAANLPNQINQTNGLEYINGYNRLSTLGNYYNNAPRDDGFKSAINSSCEIPSQKGCHMHNCNNYPCSNIQAGKTTDEGDKSFFSHFEFLHSSADRIANKTTVWNGSNLSMKESQCETKQQYTKTSLPCLNKQDLHDSVLEETPLKTEPSIKSHSKAQMTPNSVAPQSALNEEKNTIATRPYKTQSDCSSVPRKISTAAFNSPQLGSSKRDQTLKMNNNVIINRPWTVPSSLDNQEKIHHSSINNYPNDESFIDLTALRQNNTESSKYLPTNANNNNSNLNITVNKIPINSHYIGSSFESNEHSKLHTELHISNAAAFKSNNQMDPYFSRKTDSSLFNYANALPALSNSYHSASPSKAHCSDHSWYINPMSQFCPLTNYNKPHISTRETIKAADYPRDYSLEAEYYQGNNAIQRQKAHEIGLPSLIE